MKVVTLNLWNINAPLEERMARIVRFLRRVEPDVVAFQEVSLVAGQPQSKALARAAGLSHHSFHMSGEWSGRKEGLALASRATSMDVRVHELPPVANDGRRICQLAEVVLADSQWWICNLHLAYHADAHEGRMRQLCSVLQFLGEDALVRPGILLGDLNDESASTALSPLRASALRDAWDANPGPPPFTFARANPWVRDDLWPDRTIDHVWTTPAVVVRRVYLALATADTVASDHYAVVAELDTDAHTAGHQSAPSDDVDGLHYGEDAPRGRL